MEDALKKIALPIFCILIVVLAYANSVKQSDVEADELQKLVDEVNLREERLNEALQPMIERNKRLNETLGLVGDE